MDAAPTDIHYQSDTRTLTLTWPDDAKHELSAEFLRVHSPSAEVRGHGKGQEVLQVGKREVTITGLEPAGHYALKITFSDGHDSGLFDWSYLHHLGENRDSLWQSYLDNLQESGQSRDSMFLNVKQL